MNGMKKYSKKENDDLITLTLGEGIAAPSAPVPTRHASARKLWRMHRRRQRDPGHTTSYYG
jgi:hypothetical protein